MRIAAQRINNSGIEVSRMKVRHVTEKYTKQLGQSCELLYDAGYLTSPYYYDENSFMTCLFEEHPDIVPLCRNVTSGSIILSDKQMSYIMKYIGSEHEAYGVLSAAKDAYQASQALSDIADFLSRVRFKKKDDILLCRSSLAVSSRVYSSGKLPMDSPYLRECFYVEPGYHVEEFNYSIELLRVVLENIGVDKPIKWSSPSLFLGDRFTVADDCEFLTSIISGDIAGCGEYADKLHKAVEFYYSDYYANRTTIAECIKYEEQMFLDSIKNSISVINEFRQEHPDFVEFFVDSQRVYWLAPGVVEKSVDRCRDIYIGSDISCIGDTGVCLMNRLLGYSGQFLYPYDPASKQYEMVGMPVMLYAMNSRGERVAVEYYHSSNLRKRLKTMSVPVTGGSEYQRIIVGVDEMLKELDIPSLEALDEEVAECIETTYKTHPDEFKLLVGMLVQALVCVMCDYTLDGHDSPNHVHLGTAFSWVTDEIYADACATAETFFLKLGF